MHIKHTLTLATLTVLSTASYAQSASNVEIYGVVDLAVAYTNNGAKTNSNAVSMSSGILRPSMLGFRGKEELNQDLQAIFTLEAGLDADTGAAKNYQGNPSSATAAAPGGTTLSGLFNRRSFVGINSKTYGTLTFGRDYTPIYWAAFDSDVLGLTLYGNLQESVAMSGTGSDRFGRASNAIFYVSPSINGFIGRAMYSMGSESAGSVGTSPSKGNRMMAVSGKYTTGGLMLTAAYQQLDLPDVTGAVPAFTGTTSARKDFTIGAKLTFDHFSVSSSYLKIKQPTIINTDGTQYSIGATSAIGNNVFHANYIRLSQNAGTAATKTANVFGLAYGYQFSKRTVMYVSYGQVNNSATASFPLVAGDPSVSPGAVGAQIKAVGFGLRHSF